MGAEQLGFLVLGLGTLVGLFFAIYTPIKSHRDKAHDKEVKDKLAQMAIDHNEELARVKAVALLEAQSTQTTAENTAAMQLLTTELKHQTELWSEAMRKNSETHGFFRQKFDAVDEHLHQHDTTLALHERELSRLGQYHPVNAPGRRASDAVQE